MTTYDSYYYDEPFDYPPDGFPEDWEELVERDLALADAEVDDDDHDPSIPCCDFRDHGGNHPLCACPDHYASQLHPFGTSKECRR